MKHSLAMLLLLALLPTITLAQTPDLDGGYTITGTNLDGSTYEGELSVSSNGATYQISRRTDDPFPGVGIYRDDIFTVAWGSAGCGVVSYRILPDGTLDGVWANAGGDQTGTEQAVPDNVDSQDVSGTYRVTGTYPDGSPYNGQLTITASGEVYQYAWEAGGSYIGVGIQHGDVVSVTWGSETCAVTSYEVQPDGTLAGSWTRIGQEQVGAEQALPSDSVEVATVDPQRALELFQLGNALRESYRYEEALAAYNEALVMVRQLGEYEGEAATLNQIGLVYDDLGQPDQALEVYFQSLEVAREHGLRSFEGNTLNNIGSVYEGLGQYAEALNYYEQALAIHREVGNRLDEGTTLNNIGNLYKRQGDYDQALIYLNQALVIHRETNNYENIGDTLGNIGSVYLNRGDDEEALVWFNQALAVQRKVGDRRGEGSTLSDIGQVNEHLGNPDLAFDYYMQALAIHRETQNQYEAATALHNIAAIYENRGDYETALDYYNQALVLRREVGDRAGEAITLNNMGAVNADMEAYETALDYYNQALTIRRELDDQPGQGLILNNIGFTYRQMERWDDARDAYTEALAFHRTANNRYQEAVAIGNLGLIAREQGQDELALDYYTQTQTIMHDLGEQEMEALALERIGSIYQDQGHSEQALDSFYEALTLYAELDLCSNERDLLDKIATVYESQGLVEEAHTYRRELEVLQCESAPSPTVEVLHENVDPSVNFNVINDSSEVVCFVYLTPVDSNDPANDWLEATETLLPGTSRQGLVAPAVYNIVLRDCSYEIMEEHTSVDLTQPFELTYSREVVCDPVRVGSLSLEGYTYLEVNELNRVLEVLHEALTIMRECDDPALAEVTPPLESAVLGGIGLAYMYQGDFQQALIYLQQAHDVAQEAGVQEIELASLAAIGLTHTFQGEYEQAIATLNQALAQAREDGDTQFEVLELFNLGLAYRLQGRVEEALAKFDEALTLAIEYSERELEGMIRAAIAESYRLLGRYDEALEQANLAREIGDELGNPQINGLAMGTEALVQADRGWYTEALSLSQQSRTLFEESGNRLAAAENLNTTGAVYLLMGQYKEAITHFDEALEISREYDILHTQALTLGNIGTAHAYQGRFGLALDYYNQAFVLVRQLGARPEEMGLLINIAVVYETQGRHSESLAALDEALAIATAIGDQAREGIILNNKGTVYLEQGDTAENPDFFYQQALGFFSQALAIRRSLGERDGEAITLLNIGETHRRLGEYERALQFLNQALSLHEEVGNVYGQAAALNSIGRVYFDQEDYEEALDYFLRSLEVARRSGSPILINMALTDLGGVYEQLDQIENAIERYEEAVTIAEQVLTDAALDVAISGLLRRVENSRPYQRLSILLAQQDRLEEALEYAERGRAILTRTELATGVINFRTGLDQSLLEEEANLRLALNEAQRVLDSLEQDPGASQASKDQAELERDLARSAYEDHLEEMQLEGGFLSRQMAFEAATLTQIQAALPADTTLLVYATGDSESIVFIITSTTIDYALLSATRAQIEVERRAFASTNYGQSPSNALRNIYELVIAPIANQLTTSRLLISADGPLNYIPFAALQDPNGAYLIDRYAIGMTPSATVFTLLSQRDQSSLSSTPALVLAQPIAPGLPRLRYARVEAMDIAHLLGVNENIDATETDLRSNVTGSSILHISAHAQLEPFAPLFSVIHLRGDATYDGRLEVREIYELDLSQGGELVVLSGCETNSGGDGEDFGLLTRAFFVAGAQRVVASLWSVDDQVTVDLLTTYMQERLTAANEADALRTAMLAIRQTHPEPYFWASFVLTGLQ